jgi:hypothetical protein
VAQQEASLAQQAIDLPYRQHHKAGEETLAYPNQGYIELLAVAQDQIVYANWP